MRAQVIPASELSDDLARQWRAIIEGELAYDSPCFHPEYTRAAASVRSASRVAILEDGGQPIGFFPFERKRWRAAGPIGGPMTDFQGVIARSGAAWTPAQLVADCGLRAWDFDHLVEPEGRFASHCRSQAHSPYIDVSGGLPALERALQARGSRVMKKIRYQRNRLERERGPLRLEADCRDRDALQRVFEWKSAQCAATGLPDVFGVPWTVGMIERIFETRCEDYGGVLSALRAGDALVAAHFGMRAGGVWHWWFPVYNRALALYSPGMILLLCILESASSLGLTRIDLGKGDEQYKDRLKTGDAILGEGSVELPSVSTWVRSARRSVEATLRAANLPAWVRGPLRAVRRWERQRKYG